MKRVGSSRRISATILLVSLALSGIALLQRPNSARGIDLSSAPLLGGWGGTRLKDVAQNSTGPASLVFSGEKASNFEQLAVRESQLGYNTIRASFAPYCSLHYGLNSSTDFMGNYTQADVSRALSIAERFNLWIIIDYHGFDEFTNSSLVDCWTQFWFGPSGTTGPTGVVGAFKDEYSRIIWEPLNEPDSDSFPVESTAWCNNNQIACEANLTAYASAQYQSWLNKDRRAGDNHWVVVQNLCSFACNLDDSKSFLDYPKVNDTMQRVYESLHTYMYYPKLVEHVAYDYDNNSIFESGVDAAIVGYIRNNTPLAYDSKLKFVNSTNDPSETWAKGNAVIYDVNKDYKFDIGDVPVTGTVPAIGTPLKSDPLIRFVDSDTNGVWDGWNNSTADTAARFDYLGMLNETESLGWPILNTEGGPFCGAECPNIVPGAAGYSDVSLRYIQDIINYEDTSVPRIARILWVAASWTSTPNAGEYGALNPSQWGTIITSKNFTIVPINHLIAVTGIRVADRTISAGTTLQIGVNVENAGEVPEKNFNVTAYYNNTVIGKQTIASLPVEATLTLSFTWNTTRLRPGNYELKAVSSQVAGQTDASQSTKTVDVSIMIDAPSNGFAELLILSAAVIIAIAASIGIALHFRRVSAQPFSEH